MNVAELASKEWLETNGLGGWASSTFSGAHSRRYHGLLVAATRPPVGRMVLLSKLDEALITNSERFELSCNQYPGVLHPQGFEYLVSTERGLFPSFEYECGGARLRKTVAALQGENSTLVCYELLSANGPVKLELLPLTAPRDYHGLARENSFLRWDYQFEAGLLELQPYSLVPKFFIQVPGSQFVPKQAWFKNFQYALEQERGLDFEEDLFSYGNFEVELKPGQPLYVLISTEDPSGRDAAGLFKAEALRRQALQTTKDPLARRLAQAADQFLVQRGAGMTVIAGYPWFTDWGRDTMIALRGLCLSTKRFAQAKAILESFLGGLSQGMLPNRFPDAGEAPEYNTVDATLWLFVAVYDYWKKSGDADFTLKRCLPALLDILDWHRKGTRYGIKVDGDGLLNAGETGQQLTWMDAKVGDWVVTPRQGKAVEINALWVNALWICGELGQNQALKDEASAAKAAFSKAFWNQAASCCYDVLGPEGPDASLRPNQIFSLSLPLALFEELQAEAILSKIEQKLLTPRGLRTLSPDDSRYVPRYQGSVAQRDGAYHQGTVWPWLLGPYAEALIRVRGSKGVAQAKQLLADFAPHLDEAGLGTVSEIFDAEAPHLPRGCPAQAWSVAELLRIQLDFLS